MQGLESLLIGLLAGVFIAGGGYFKAHTAENFDEYRFFVTVLLGAVAGMASWMLGGSTETWLEKVTLFAQSSGLAIQIEMWAKVFKRRLAQGSPKQ